MWDVYVYIYKYVPNRALKFTLTKSLRLPEKQLGEKMNVYECLSNIKFY